ncbi:conserved hypothetical protein [Roseibium sp. TrichSKD4]|nr:conserved hypothetical protein [Roseibium sp. TrichSKD4]
MFCRTAAYRVRAKSARAELNHQIVLFGGPMSLIFKILPRTMWQDAVAAGKFTGAPVDLADGYIHFSTAEQAEETAAKHFVGQTDLVLVACDADVLGAALKWEPSRGGVLFPHLYDTLSVQSAHWVKDLPLGDDGKHQFPDLTQ